MCKETSPIYQVRGLVKAYGGRRVLSVEALDVYAGEILAVVGPSGAGKSTLLRLLDFLETPDEGVIRFMGTEYGANRPIPLSLRRQVAMVFQRPVLLNRSVWANVVYGLHLRGERDSAAAVGAILETLGLTKIARQPARTLSGGEVQRVALARALVLRPAVLLLDEPTANLDPHNVQLIEEAVQRQNRERGTTVVLVTHNVFQARRLAHRVALLLNGRIVEVAPVPDFFDSPRDPRARAFVRGEMVC